jgi:2-phosphoglycolate phosphatase
VSRISAVLFDLDGTLLDSAPDLVGALNWLRAEEGLPALPVNEVSRHASRGATGLLQAGMPAADAQRFEAWRSLFLARYAEHSYVHSSLYAGVPELLDFLASSDIPWGIVTNKFTALTLPILQAAGLSDKVGCVVCGDTLSRNKPDPAPVILACELLKTPVAETVFAGDDVRDLQAGRAAGTMTAAVYYGYGSYELDDTVVAGSLPVHHPSDLIRLVGHAR